MHVMLCESSLWVPTSIVPNPLYVQHLDPQTFYHPKYGLVISNSYKNSGAFLDFLETGALSKAYPPNANIDLGVTFGVDGVLRSWHRAAGKIHHRTFQLNDRMPRLLDCFQTDIGDAVLATAVAIQQLQSDPKGFDGAFLRNHPKWHCNVFTLLDSLYEMRYSIRPSDEWIQIDLAHYHTQCGSLLQLPVIVGITKKGSKDDSGSNKGRETSD